MKLYEILSEKKLPSVALIIIENLDTEKKYEERSSPIGYSFWRLGETKIYLFDENYRVGHILFFDWDVEEIQPNSYYIITDQKHKLKIDLYFGGAILD
jgi:hypothetical protein